MKKATIVALFLLGISASPSLKANADYPPIPDRGKPEAPHCMTAPSIVDVFLSFFGLS